MTDLKVFVMDLGWNGNIVVIARNAQDAIDKMKGYETFPDDYDGNTEEWVNCLEIVEGLTIFNSGDWQFSVKFNLMLATVKVLKNVEGN